MTRAAVMTADVIIVTYNSEATIVDAVKSVIDDPVVGEVVVVDNLSTDGSADVAEATGARVIRNPVNSGFGAGCNLGAHGGDREWMLLLNPDAAMKEGSLGRLLDYASVRPEVGVVASEVHDPAGRPQVVRRRFPVWWRAFAEPGTAARWDERHYRRHADPGGGPVDWVSASAVLVRRAAFDAVDGFDRDFFLYAEEIDLCLRLRQAGYTTHWVPGCPSYHAAGSSTGQLAGSGKEEWARGMGRYIAKHSDHPAATRTSLLLGQWAHALMWAARRNPVYYEKWRSSARVVARRDIGPGAR